MFYPRLLLLHSAGATSYKSLRTFEGITYRTYHDACVARGLTTSDSQWRMALREAAASKMPAQIRQLFAFIVALNAPTNPAELWEEFKIAMSEDFGRDYSSNEAFNKSLSEIDDILLTQYVVQRSRFTRA